MTQTERSLALKGRLHSIPSSIRLFIFVSLIWAPPALNPALSFDEADCIRRVADFEDSRCGDFPTGWFLRRGFSYGRGNGNRAWHVRAEGDNHFLEAVSEGDAFTVGVECRYRLEELPFLYWRWRIHELPRGGDERHRATQDSAAGIYVVFPGFPLPRSIKYVWSSTLPPETLIASPFNLRAWIIVVRSGTSGLGEWTWEERNVWEDYQRAFRKTPPTKNPKAIALLTDSDSTNTRARADYDDITISSRARLPRVSEKHH